MERIGFLKHTLQRRKEKEIMEKRTNELLRCQRRHGFLFCLSRKVSSANVWEALVDGFCLA
jgi:hypothetical protein